MVEGLGLVREQLAEVVQHEIGGWRALGPLLNHARHATEKPEEQRPVIDGSDDQQRVGRSAVVHAIVAGHERLGEGNGEGVVAVWIIRENYAGIML